MAIGDDAVLAGMPLVTGGTLANTIDDEINLTRDLIAQRTAPAIAHASALYRQIAATNSFTNQTTYADFPDSTDAAAMQITFVKESDDTKLILLVMASANFTSGSAQRMYVGLRVGGTDYDVARMQFATASNRTQMMGTVEVTSLAAGTYTIKPRFKSASSAQVSFTTSDFVSYSVQELG